MNDVEKELQENYNKRQAFLARVAKWNDEQPWGKKKIGDDYTDDDDYKLKEVK